MKNNLFRAAALAACLTLSAASLSGCMTAFGIGQSIGSSVTQNVQDALDNSLSNTGAGVAGSIISSIPHIDEIIDSKDNPNDHRETSTITGNQEAALSLTFIKASQIILRQGGEGDTYQLAYDPEHFRVEKGADGDAFSLNVTMPNDSAKGTDPQYKCYITIPEREFTEIRMKLDYSGVALDGIASPLNIDNTSGGLVISNPRADVTLREQSGAFAADIPSDFSHSFRYDGSSGVFSLRFIGGEPENFRFKAEYNIKDAVIVQPSAWPGSLNGFDYSKGSGGATFDFTLKNGAGVISVE